MTNGRLLLILIVAAASGCAGAEYAIAPPPPVLTPSGPPAGPAADIFMNVAKATGVTFPSGGGFGFLCASGGGLRPGQTPADVAFPYLIIQARSGISGVVVDSILHTSEQGAAVRRFMFIDLGPLGTGSISFGWAGDSPLIAQTESAARVQFTVAGVVYYHRGRDHFVSPKVSYSCDP